MKGSSAVLHGHFGRGQVVLVSPHVESSTNHATATIFTNLFRLAAGAALLSTRAVEGGRQPQPTRQAVADDMSIPTAPLPAAAAPPCEAARHIFAYGSLRPDDTTGMFWTISFNVGMIARKASIGPARLFEDQYACVVLGASDGGEELRSGGESPRVVGYVLSCDDAKAFAKKLRTANEIEGYRPGGGGLYEREVVETRLEKSGEIVLAYVYHRPQCSRAKRLWSGDWQRRHEEPIAVEQMSIAPSASVHSTSVRACEGEGLGEEEDEAEGEDEGEDQDSEDDANDEDEQEDSVEEMSIETGASASDSAATAIVVLPSPILRDNLLGANPHARVRVLPIAPPSVAPSRPPSSQLSSTRLGKAPAAAAPARPTFTSSSGNPRNKLSAKEARSGSSSSNQRATTDCYSSTEAYVCGLSAPILFTAPHGLKLKKGSGVAQSARHHARERYTTEIVLILAVKHAERRGATCTRALASSAVESAAESATPVPSSAASFMVWNYKMAPIDDPRHMDPNYLSRATAVHSPWHSCLHAWKAKHGYSHGEACPTLLHIDIHGKNDRENNMDIDVGMVPMEEEGCLSVDAVRAFKAIVASELRKAFAGHSAISSKSKRLLPVTVEAEPCLHGYWGEETWMTMSHQSVLLGATSLQLELPNAVRKLLMADAKLMDGFANALYNAYDALRLACLARFEPLPSWSSMGGHGFYLAGMGTARKPLCELVVSESATRVETITEMLRDLERADAGSVHGKSI